MSKYSLQYVFLKEYDYDIETVLINLYQYVLFDKWTIYRVVPTGHELGTI